MTSGKGKTLRRVKRSVVARDQEEEKQTGRAQRIFRAVQLLCISCNSGGVSLNICQNRRTHTTDSER